MSLAILVTVIVTSTIQSVFGVGVLLFGTPLLLIAGYEFIQALYILLPISLTINLFQIIKDYSHIDKDFYKKILKYTIPFVVFFLFIVSTSKINLGLIIGLFLIFVAVKNYLPQVEKAVESCVKYEREYFIVMGIIHGLTNLGGSLLTAIVHSKNYDKDKTRVTVASAYATFAFFQLLTLWIAATSSGVNYATIGIYWILGIMTFYIAENIVYATLDDERYSKIFAVFLFVSGILLIAKSF